jgi:CPA2 family monovalent cation:H+ antiporter-2
MAALLLEAGVVFAVLAVGGALAGRLRQSVIPAYILAGLLVGPNAPTVGGVDLAVVQTREFVTLLSELGIVFLLFFVGLEFNLERLAASRERILRAGAIDLGINGVVGLALGLALGFSVLGAVFLAGVVYISSSAVITKSLIDLGWIADPESDAILGTLVFEDVAIAVYLAVLAALVGTGEATVVGDLATATGLPDPAVRLGVAAVVVVALVALSTHGTAVLDRLLATDSTEQFLLRTVAAAVLVGGIALAAGVSEAVAAFFLGAAFGATDHVERIERVIASERDLYAAVFFLSIGLGTDPGPVAAVALPVVVLVVVTTASKLVSGFLGGRAYGLDRRRSTRVALAMVARGEFSLVIAGLAATVPAAELGGAIQPLVVGYVLAMSVLGTVLMRLSDPINRLVADAGATRSG